MTTNHRRFKSAGARDARTGVTTTAFVVRERAQGAGACWQGVVTRRAKPGLGEHTPEKEGGGNPPGIELRIGTAGRVALKPRGNPVRGSMVAYLALSAQIHDRDTRADLAFHANTWRAGSSFC